MSTSFGRYKGRSVQIIHACIHKEHGGFQLPMISKFNKDIYDHHLRILSRYEKEGFESQYLHLDISGHEQRFERVPGTNRYILINKNPIVKALDSFKMTFRLKRSLVALVRQARARRFARSIHEELVMKVCHPDRILRLMEQGYDLDAILEV
jgi:hypothetical protein